MMTIFEPKLRQQLYLINPSTFFVYTTASTDACAKRHVGHACRLIMSNPNACELGPHTMLPAFWRFSALLNRNINATMSFPTPENKTAVAEPRVRYIPAPKNAPARIATKKLSRRFRGRFLRVYSFGSTNRSTQAAVAIAVLISVIWRDLESTT